MREIYMLTLTDYMSGGQVCIKAHSINSMLEYREEDKVIGTTLYTDGGPFVVKETPDKIKEKLKGSLGLWRDVVVI